MGEMTKEQILGRIDELLRAIDQPTGNTRFIADRLLAGTLTVIAAVHGEGSLQVKNFLSRRDSVAASAESESSRLARLVAIIVGGLHNLREEVESGLMSSLERRVASDVLSDLVRLARAALDESGTGAKNVAAVLAAAAYEDTLRRIARDHAGHIGRDDLADVVTHLKNAGLLVPPQLSVVTGHLNFRNHALHANWDTIERASVASVLGLVEELLLKHFS
jgi:hypothetical protein